MDDWEIFGYIWENLGGVRGPEAYPVLPKDESPESRPEFFEREVAMVFPAISGYFGMDALAPPEVYRPDDRSAEELAGAIASDKQVSMDEARDILKSEMGPTLITFSNRPPAIWSGYFRPNSETFYREAALEETAHYVNLSMEPKLGTPEYASMVEGLASGAVSEIGNLIPGYGEAARRETIRQIQSVCKFKAAEKRPDTVEFDQYDFGRVWYALGTAEMDAGEKKEFLNRAIRGEIIS